MSDIIERLGKLEACERELAREGDCPPEATANWAYADICAEAAAEIVSLRANQIQGTEGDELVALREETTRLKAEVERLTEVANQAEAEALGEATECEHLKAEVERLRAAVSWLDIVDVNTPLLELRQRIKFCLDDVRRASIASSQEPWT